MGTNYEGNEKKRREILISISHAILFKTILDYSGGGIYPAKRKKRDQ
jgi:hypothetical protein